MLTHHGGRGVLHMFRQTLAGLRPGGASGPEETNRKLSRAIRAGLHAAGVPDDSIHDQVVERGPAALAWRAGLPPERSLLQANYAVSHRVEEAGGQVISGREEQGPHGGSVVTLLLGTAGHPTHELTLARGAASAKPGVTGPVRIAVVVYGFTDPKVAQDFASSRAPFALALTPAMPAAFRAARAAGHEIVLHLPLEPVNYPQVNPGPGTILVSLPPARITGVTRRDLDQAGPVAAVANLMGSLATQDVQVMTAVFEELARRHLPFIHTDPVAGAVCKSLAARMGVVYDHPGAVLDRETRPGHETALRKSWQEALARARERGVLMVWVRATPATRAWLTQALSAKSLGGVQVAPLTQVLRHPAEL